MNGQGRFDERKHRRRRDGRFQQKPAGAALIGDGWRQSLREQAEAHADERLVERVTAATVSFTLTNKDAYAWRQSEDGHGPGGEFLPDCDVLADAFTEHSNAMGVEARTVVLHSDPEDDAAADNMLDRHWISVLNVDGRSVGVDFTARQFFDCPHLGVDPADIPCPLVWELDGSPGGGYPLDGIDFALPMTADSEAA